MNRLILCFRMVPVLELLFQVVLQPVKIRTFFVYLISSSCSRFIWVCMHHFLLDSDLISCNCVYKGIYEALELRDGGSDYLGKGVFKVYAYHVLMTGFGVYWCAGYWCCFVLFPNLIFGSWWCSGCRECQFHHWTSLDWQGNIWKLISLLDLELQRVIDLMWVFLQDPTEQVQIDNFMVQQLDGTVNEWGWCKQKVCLSS